MQVSLLFFNLTILLNTQNAWCGTTINSFGCGQYNIFNVSLLFNEDALICNK